MPKLIITTPVYRSVDAIIPECRETIYALREAGLAMPEWFIKPGPEIFRNRNDAIKCALKVEGWTHMLCIDGDISLPDAVADIGRMVRRGLDIVGGAYRMRRDDGVESLCAGSLGKGFVGLNATGLHAVDFVGAGCLLISRGAIDALGPLWFRHEFNEDRTNQTAEDVGFCQHARAHGYVVWLDCTVNCVHHCHQAAPAATKGPV